MTKTISLVCAGIVLATLAIFAATQQNASAVRPDNSAEGASLNNLGAAYMNQQLFDKALKSF